MGKEIGRGRCSGAQLVWSVALAFAIALDNFGATWRGDLPAYPHQHTIELAKLGLGYFLQLDHVMVFDPALEKPCGNRNDEPEIAMVLRIHAAKPAGEKIITQFSPQPL